MATIPDYLGSFGALAHKLLVDHEPGKTDCSRVEMRVRNWRAARQTELADLVEAAINSSG